MPFHPRKPPERVLQSQIDKALNAYLWNAAYTVEQTSDYWRSHYAQKTERFKKAWLALLEVQRRG